MDEKEENEAQNNQEDICKAQNHEENRNRIGSLSLKNEASLLRKAIERPCNEESAEEKQEKKGA